MSFNAKMQTLCVFSCELTVKFEKKVLALNRVIHDSNKFCNFEDKTKICLIPCYSQGFKKDSLIFYSNKLEIGKGTRKCDLLFFFLSLRQEAWVKTRGFEKGLS